MITAFVQFKLPKPVLLAEATRLFEASTPKYRNLPGLIRKYYLLGDDGVSAGGVYLWESRADAERLYTSEWREKVTSAYGSAPVITWFNCPVIVDNLANDVTVAA